MTSDTIELFDRVRAQLSAAEKPFELAATATDADIEAAEETLGITFPPSYRLFLTRIGGLAIPPHLGVVHHFVGLSPLPPDGKGVVDHTLAARTERKLPPHLLVVGMGADFQEWFCLDVNREGEDGEYPVLLFDARDNAMDQQFYPDFGQMLREVLGFVEETLSTPLD
jgi:hypothetical protein